MKKFLTDDFLLKSDIAKKLYHSYASELPIIDYHCHVSPKEVYEDKRFENITPRKPYTCDYGQQNCNKFLHFPAPFFLYSNIEIKICQ